VPGPAPQADLRHGDLDALPVENAGADLVVCSLALTHLPDLDAPVGELARVVRPGGRIVISDVHPFFVALGSQAFYREEDGQAGYVRNFVHWPSAYLRAFRAAGLELRDCHELLYRREEIDLWAHTTGLSAEVVAEALEGLPAIIVWELDRHATASAATGAA
jgi:ubiquinone/menaquinone biosynthesis C-methylase UbiE